MSEDQRRPMKGIRRVTAERLGTGWATKPQVTLFRTVDWHQTGVGGLTVALAYALVQSLVTTA